MNFERKPLTKQSLGIGRFRPEIFEEILEEHKFEMNTPERRESIRNMLVKATGAEIKDISSEEDIMVGEVKFRMQDNSNNRIFIISSKWTIQK